MSCRRLRPSWTARSAAAVRSSWWAARRGSGRPRSCGRCARTLRAAVTFVAGACEPLSVPVPLAPLRELAEAAGWGRCSTTVTASRSRAPCWAPSRDAGAGAGGDRGRALGGPRHRRRASAARTAPRGHAGFALLVTYRDDELARQPRSRAPGRRPRDGALRQRIALRALSEHAVRELARAGRRRRCRARPRHGREPVPRGRDDRRRRTLPRVGSRRDARACGAARRGRPCGRRRRGGDRGARRPRCA